MNTPHLMSYLPEAREFLYEHVWDRLDEVFTEPRIVDAMLNEPKLMFLNNKMFCQLYENNGWHDHPLTVGASYHAPSNIIYMRICDELDLENLMDYLIHEAAHAVVHLAGLQSAFDDAHSYLFWRTYYEMLKFFNVKHYPYVRKVDKVYKEGDRLIRRWTREDSGQPTIWEKMKKLFDKCKPVRYT